MPDDTRSSGIKVNRGDLGDSRAQQLRCNGRGRALPVSRYDLIRLYDALVESSPHLTIAPASRKVGGRQLLPGVHPRRTNAVKSRCPQLLNVGFARLTIRYAIPVGIAAASFIGGLNFELFASQAAQVPELYRLGVYHLSGQANVDKKAREELARLQQQRIEQQQELELQRAKQEQDQEQDIKAQYAKEDQVRLARIERTRQMTEAWQEFLTASRPKLKQIELIKDARFGEYNCLRVRNMLWDFVSPYKRNPEIARQKAEVSTYQIRDTISDEFVRWLNANQVLDRTDWKYADLHNAETDFSVGCLSPDQAWRATRYYEQMYDMTPVIMALPM